MSMQAIERPVTEIRTALPEVTALEAWRLALGWSRVETIEQISNPSRLIAFVYVV
ncbi:hypothetical protein ACFW6K_22215 [Streptomyces sp. NPDC058733]|uniref:hypothetical protein n=1 Tax=Streptomyces TaxID=1883 RepID=UPI00339FD8A4